MYLQIWISFFFIEVKKSSQQLNYFIILQFKKKNARKKRYMWEVEGGKNYKNSLGASWVLMMMCIWNMVIRKILILRVWRWPYLAIIRHIAVSVMIWIAWINGMERVGRSWWRVSFVVVMNGKYWYHLFIIHSTCSIPFNMMHILLRFMIFIWFLMCGKRWGGVCSMIKIWSERAWFWRLARRASVWWWNIGRWYIVWVILICSPHQYRLPLKNLIVIWSAWWWWIFQFRLHIYHYLRRCWIWIWSSTRNQIVIWRWRCYNCIHRWGFRCFLFIMCMLYDLFVNIFNSFI